MAEKITRKTTTIAAGKAKSMAVRDTALQLKRPQADSKKATANNQGAKKIRKITAFYAE